MVVSDFCRTFALGNLSQTFNTLFIMTREQIKKDVQRIFNEHKCYYDFDVDFTICTIEVSVEWGDWKHDHLFLRHIMMENHYLPIGEDVTEEDGSDTYSSIHYFVYSGGD